MTASERGAEERPDARITIYSKPDCVNCERTKALFDRQGVPYELVDLSTASDAVLDYIAELAYRQAPIVVVSDQDHWSGLRLDEILRVSRLFRAAS